MADTQDRAPVEQLKYEDVPEDWRKHWIAMGVPEGEFPPGIDDSDFFAQFEQGAARFEKDENEE